LLLRGEKDQIGWSCQGTICRRCEHSINSDVNPVLQDSVFLSGWVGADFSPHGISAQSIRPHPTQAKTRSPVADKRTHRPTLAPPLPRQPALQPRSQPRELVPGGGNVEQKPSLRGNRIMLFVPECYIIMKDKLYYIIHADDRFQEPEEQFYEATTQKILSI
jgi:hypothetical protein